MFFASVAGRGTDTGASLGSRYSRLRPRGSASGPRGYVMAFSLALNIGFIIYLACQWLAPFSPYRTPEERMQVYLQFLPDEARADYRDRISGKLSMVLSIHKQVHAERQAIADMLAKDPVDKVVLYKHFETIRSLNQQINRVYQEALVDVEVGLPLEERMKSRNVMSGFIKHDQSAAQ